MYYISDIMCIYIYIHIHVYTYIYIYTHIRICLSVCLFVCPLRTLSRCPRVGGPEAPPSGGRSKHKTNKHNISKNKNEINKHNINKHKIRRDSYSSDSKISGSSLALKRTSTPSDASVSPCAARVASLLRQSTSASPPSKLWECSGLSLLRTR